MTTGVEERETRQRVTKRARTRAHTHSHAPTPLAQGGKHAEAHIVYIAVVLHKSQQQPLSMQGMRERRQTRRKRGAEGERARENLASLHEAHRLSLSARAKHSRQRSSWSAGNSTDAKGSEDRMTSPGANAR